MVLDALMVDKSVMLQPGRVRVVLGTLSFHIKDVIQYDHPWFLGNLRD